MIRAVIVRRRRVGTDREHGGEPEGGLRERHRERAHVGPADHVVVEVVQHEVRHQRAPDCDMIEHRPVRRVQCDLRHTITTKII